MDAPQKQPKVSAEPAPATVVVLERMLAAARAGNVINVVVAYTNKAGQDGVQASPMNVITLNHLWRLLDERVRGAYREVRQRDKASRSPTAAMSVTAPKAAAAAAALPRAVRRAVAKAQLKAATKAMRPPPKPDAATN